MFLFLVILLVLNFQYFCILYLPVDFPAGPIILGIQCSLLSFIKLSNNLFFVLHFDLNFLYFQNECCECSSFFGEGKISECCDCSSF